MRMGGCVVRVTWFFGPLPVSSSLIAPSRSVVCGASTSAKAGADCSRAAAAAAPTTCRLDLTAVVGRRAWAWEPRRRRHASAEACIAAPRGRRQAQAPCWQLTKGENTRTGLEGVSSDYVWFPLVILFPVCPIVPFSDAWEGHAAHVAEQHALVAHAVAKDAVHLPPGEDRGRAKIIRGLGLGQG